MNHISDLSTIEEMLCRKATLSHTPVSGAFELTPFCNLDCKMCYIKEYPTDKINNNVLIDYQSWIDLAKEISKQGLLFLLLTGGEPLLYPNFKELYTTLKRMGLILTINSNGILINNEWADFFSDNLPRRINITLYGATNKTYEKICNNSNGFDLTLAAIHRLKQRNIDIKLNASIIKDNYQEVELIIDIAKELNVPIEFNTYMFPCNRNHKLNFQADVRIDPKTAAKLDIIIREKLDSDKFDLQKNKFLNNYIVASQNTNLDRSMKCRAGKSSFWVNWKGYLTPCVFLESPGYSILNEKSNFNFKTAWHNLNEDCDRILLPIKCTSCGHRHNCHVCAACAYWEGGNYDKQPYYLCETMENTYQQLSAL